MNQYCLFANISNKRIILAFIHILNILIINCSNAVQSLTDEMKLTTSLEYNLSLNQDNSYKFANPLPVHPKKRRHSTNSITDYPCMLEAEQLPQYQSCSSNSFSYSE